MPATPHLLREVQPAVVDVVLGEGGHRLGPLPKRQVAVVGFADHQVMQLLWTSVVVLNLEESMQECGGLQGIPGPCSTLIRPPAGFLVPG